VARFHDSSEELAPPGSVWWWLAGDRAFAERPYIAPEWRSAAKAAQGGLSIANSHALVARLKLSDTHSWVKIRPISANVGECPTPTWAKCLSTSTRHNGIMRASLASVSRTVIRARSVSRMTNRRGLGRRHPSREGRECAPAHR
jgi:hypothetical protein